MNFVRKLLFRNLFAKEPIEVSPVIDIPFQEEIDSYPFTEVFLSPGGSDIMFTVVFKKSVQLCRMSLQTMQPRLIKGLKGVIVSPALTQDNSCYLLTSLAIQEFDVSTDQFLRTETKGFEFGPSSRFIPLGDLRHLVLQHYMGQTMQLFSIERWAVVKTLRSPASDLYIKQNDLHRFLSFARQKESIYDANFNKVDERALPLGKSPFFYKGKIYLILSKKRRIEYCDPDDIFHLESCELLQSFDASSLEPTGPPVRVRGLEKVLGISSSGPVLVGLNKNCRQLYIIDPDSFRVCRVVETPLLGCNGRCLLDGDRVIIVGQRWQAKIKRPTYSYQLIPTLY
ncbi:MAG: hypothetical protein HQL30_12350 [Candidatus Omnitrophica bacterium]|nr:hypothetical protein [Candidatus Omnitrophota bacterium]